MKRFLSVIVTLSMFLLLMYGCADQPASTTSQQEDTSTPTSASEDESVSEVETILVWSGSGHARDLFTAEIDAYNNSQGKEDGIFIQFESFGSDYNQMAEVALSSGQAAPIMQYPPASTPGAIEKGQLVPLDTLPGMEDMLEKYAPYIKEQSHAYDGVVYGVPFNTNTIKLVYNKDLFVAAGIVDENGEAMPPKTWAEVAEYAKLLTDPASKTYGIALPMKWSAYFDWELIQPFAASTGALHFDYETGEFDFENIRPALEFLTQIRDDNSYFPGPESLDNDPARAQFSEGRIGMKLAASWDVGVYNDQFPAQIEWGVAPIPLVSEDSQYVEWSESVAFWKLSSTVNDYNLEKVATVYKFLNSDEILIKAYEQGKFIPYSDELIAQANVTEAKNGWAEFADGKILAYPRVPSVTVEGSVYTEEMMKIFAGSVSIDEAIADLDTRYNAALESAVADGRINIDNFIYPDMEADYKIN